MTRIIADSGDDNEPDEFDRSDPDDELDPDDEPDEDDEPPVQPARKPARPTYQELMAENDRLKRGNTRNNQELKKRRQVQEWMERHEITDLDEWLTTQGIDRETGQRAAAPPAPVPPPAPAPAPEPANDDMDRRLALELEKRQAQWDEQAAELEERTAKLNTVLARQAVEAALAKNGFGGTYEKALRVVDLESIQIDDDGNITGAEEAVASLRTEIPEWFRPPRNGRARTGGEDVDGGRKPPKPPARPTWEQQALSRLTGGSR